MFVLRDVTASQRKRGERRPGTETLINPLRLSRVMARLVIRDRGEYISFSDGCLPSSDRMVETFPSRSRLHLPFTEMPSEAEERRAWLLTAHAVQIADYQGYDCTRQAPFETWIIGTPRGPPAVFAPWFDGQPIGYRLLIHRSPLADRGANERGLSYEGSWGSAYLRVGLTGRRHQPSQTLARPVYELLERVLDSCVAAEAGRAPLLSGLGHYFAGSLGPRNWRSKRLSTGS